MRFGYISLIVAVILCGRPLATAADDPSGIPRVLSGDTILIGQDKIRLLGIDAPEKDQYCENEYGRPFECGLQAMDALTELIGRQRVTCVGEVRDDEGLLLSTCFAGDMNLNSRMVRTGWAVARDQERADYAVLEQLARREKAGIWKLKFIDPAEWRRQSN